jgi:hypothetical protein
MDSLALIARRLAEPMTHCVITSYACGKTKRHETRSAEAAENWAVGERRKLGRDLLDRDTGKTVRVVSVAIEPLI